MSDDYEIIEKSKPLTKIAGKPSTAKSANTKTETKTVKTGTETETKTVTKPTSRPIKKSSEKKTKKPDDKIDVNVKVVRDSFTMPQSDYVKLNELKLVCLKAGLQVKKSELLRAGLHALCKLNTEQLAKAIEQIEQIKTGRPKNPEATSKRS